jgi:lipopolysaccharide transport system permease protein
MMNDLRSSRFVAYRLFQRDIKAKYRQAILGYLWAFVPSIVVAFGLVAATNAKVISIGETNLPYPAYVMLSMVLWQTFLEALNAPLLAVTESKTMLAKINFPRESIVLAKIMEVFFNFLVKLILVVLLYFFYEMPITWNAVFAFIGVFQIVLLGTFLGLLIAPLGAIYQDVSRGVMVGTTVLFFITPVIFPQPKAGLFATIVSLNPVTPLLVTTRELATTGIVSDLHGAILVSGLSLLGFFVTWVVFRLSIPYVIERMPS